MSQIDTTPPSFDMASTEVLPFPVDFTNVLGGGEVVSAPSSILRDLTTNNSYPIGLSGNPTLSGNIITQVVKSLQPLHRYELLVTMIISGKTTTWTSRTTINCIV